MEDLRKRCELDKNDCWDISKIIKDEKEYQDLVTAVKKENQKIVSMRGHTFLIFLQILILDSFLLKETQRYFYVQHNIYDSF